jgi:hypothetical protein
MSTETEVDGMTRRTRHLKWAGTSVAIAIALAAPTAAPAGTRTEVSPASVARSSVAAGNNAQEQTAAATGRAGLDRRDAVVAVAILVCVLLMGVWGYVVVGALIAVAAALLGGVTRLVTGKPKRGRGWSDWPDSATGRVSRPAASASRSRRRSRRTLPSAPRSAR